MTGYSFINPYTPIVNDNGVPLPGAKLYFTREGTNTPTDIYADPDLNTPLTNPVVADSSGKTVPFYLDASVSYRLRVYRANQTVGVSTPLKDYDPFQFNFSVDSESITFTQEGTGAVTRPLRDKILEMAVSVEDFRAPGDTTDTAAFLRAVTEAASSERAVYLPAGKGLGADGVYLITTYPTSLPSGTTVIGGGKGRTIVRPVASGSSVFYQESVNNESQDANLTFLDMTLYGYSETGGFIEQVPLISSNGIDNLLIERVEFKAFQGDGLTLGAGLVVDDTRANTRVTVRDCFFDGINKENRNAISVLSVDGLLVDNCYFTRTTKSTMPGAIDFEPNTEGATEIRNATIRDSRFVDIGGSIGAVCVVMPSTSPVIYNLQILNNSFHNNDWSDIAINNNRIPSATGTDSAILIDGNAGSNGGWRPFEFFGTRGITVTDNNVFETYPLGVQLGFNSTTLGVRNVYCGAKLISCGSSGQPGLNVGYADNVTLSNMLFDRCSGTGSGDVNLQFTAACTSSGIRIDNCRFVANGSQTAAIANQSGTHTFTASTNFFRDNTLGSLTSAFRASNQSGLQACSAGIATVVAPGATATSKVLVNRQTDAGTIGCSYSIVITPGTGFTITSRQSTGATQTADTSTMSYEMLP